MKRSLVPTALAAIACASSACTTQGALVVARSTTFSDLGSDRAAEVCAGLPSPEQERPSFLRHDEIQSVRPLEGGPSSVRLSTSEVRGAEIYVRGNPALTRNMAARVLRCHLVDPIALALRQPFEDPLLVGTPRVSLDSWQDGLVIRIAGHDAVEGQEILRRAEGLQRN